MADIAEWDALADNNSQPAPDGFPEGMAPSGVNNAAREVMAAVRRWYETAEWIDLGHSPSFLSATSFSVPGDVSAIYQVNRRLRLLNDSTLLYGAVSAASFTASITTITVDLDSGQLTSALQNVALGAASVSNPSINHRSLGLSDFTTAPAIATAHIADGAITSDKLGAGVRHLENLLSVNLAGMNEVFITSEITPTYPAYVMLLENVAVSAGSDINIRVSDDGGSSYHAANYSYVIHARDSSGADFSSGTQGALHIPLIASHSSALAGHSVRCRVEIGDLFSSALYKHFRAEACYFGSAGFYTQNEICGVFTGNINTIDALRLAISPGNFSAGIMAFYGVRGS